MKMSKNFKIFLLAIGIIAFSGGFVGAIAVIAHGVYFMSLKSGLYFVGVLLLLVVQLYWILGGGKQ